MTRGTWQLTTWSETLESTKLVAGSPDRRIAGSPDRRIAGSPDRRIAGSPDRRIAGSPTCAAMRVPTSRGRSRPPAFPPESFSSAVRRRRSLVAALLAVALLAGVSLEAAAQTTPTVSVSLNGPATVEEGEVAKFRLNASRMPVSDVTVHYVVVAPNGHYVSPGVRTITLPAGQTSMDLDIPTTASAKTEQASHLTVVVVGDLTAAANGTAPTYYTGTDSPTVRITDGADTAPAPVWRFAVAGGAVATEGERLRMALYRTDGTARLPAPAPETVTVAITDSTAACIDGEALGTFDYIDGTLTRTVSFKHQSSHGEFTFATVNDEVAEDDGCVTLAVTHVNGVAVSHTSEGRTLWHVRDDEPPVAKVVSPGPVITSFSGSGVRYWEVDEDTVGTITFSVELSNRGPDAPAFDLNYLVSNGSGCPGHPHLNTDCDDKSGSGDGHATKGDDFTTPAKVRVERGHNRAVIPVTIKDDNVDDSGEIITLSLWAFPEDPYRVSSDTLEITIRIVNHDPNPAPTAAPIKYCAASLSADAVSVAGIEAEIARRARNAKSTKRWNRVLKALDPSKGAGRAMTASQAETFAARGPVWARKWRPVANTLKAIEQCLANAPVQQPAPEPSLPEVTIVSGGAVTEGTEAAFRIELSEPATADLAIAVDIAEAKDSDFVAKEQEGSRTVTIEQGKQEAVFTVATVDDETAEDTGAVTATLAAGASYALGDTASASVAVADNDTPDIPEASRQTAPPAPTISPAPGAIYEGETKTFTVSGIDPAYAKVLLGTSGTAVRGSDGADDGGEDFRLKDDSDTVRSDSYEYTPSSGTLTFKVTALADTEKEPDEVTVLTLDDPDNALNTVLGAITVKDGSRPVTGVTLSATELALTEGTTGRYTLVLTKRPSGPVMIMVKSWNAVAATVNGPGGTPGETATLTFTPANWTVPQTVTVTAPEDADLADAGATISHVTVNTPGVYASIDIPDLKVKVADDDRAVAPEVSVADAKANESAGVIRFTISLNHATDKPVEVTYVTRESRPVSARENVDYLGVTGTGSSDLTFAPGETRKQASIHILGDSHDEGTETFEVVLKYPKGVTIGDGVAVGTIVNSGPIPNAWLARYGRTVATHVTDAVSDRLRTSADAPAKSQVTLGGVRLPVRARDSQAADAETAGEPGTALLASVARLLGLTATGGPATGLGPSPNPGPPLGQTQAPSLDLRQLLLGSSFRLHVGREGATRPPLTAWGRFAGTTFDGRDVIRNATTNVDGNVFTGTVGLDATGDRWVAGVAVAHSQGTGGYTQTLANAQGARGDLEQTLTSLHPYLRYALTNRLDVWGLAGYGWGQLDLTPPGDKKTLETDTTLLMGTVGARGRLLDPADTGGYALATRTEAMFSQTTSDAVEGSDAGDLAAGDAAAHRLRLILEGSQGIAWPDGRQLTPTVELGLRHDWGDAETGFGLELGGRVQYADPACGLTVEGAVRGLVAHADAAYEEWGAWGTVRLAPGPNGQGLAVTLAPTWGAAASGVDTLWSRQTTASLAPTGPQATPSWRLAAELGYGVPAFATGLVTPYAGTVLSAGADRTYRLGLRLALRQPQSQPLDLTLEGTRQEAVGPSPVNQGLRLEATWGF